MTAENLVKATSDDGDRLYMYIQVGGDAHTYHWSMVHILLVNCLISKNLYARVDPISCLPRQS
jgi:hypothetical protein